VENLLKSVLVLAAGFSLSGCAFLSLYNTTIYQPQVVDIPLIHEKGDTRFDAGSSLYSFEGTLSVGITRYLALQAFGGAGHRRHYVQGALGCYKANPAGGVLEIYAGYGGGLGTVDSDNFTAATGSYNEYFVQLNVGKLHPEGAQFGLDFGFGLQFGLQECLLENWDAYTSNGFYRTSPDYVTKNFLFEPGFFLGFGR
jgi:hypothetical protein